MKVKSKRKIKKARLSRGYKSFVAWFSKHLLFASICLIALCFSAGILFVLHLAAPIGNSEIYNVTAHRVKLAEQGIKTFTQYVIDVTSPVFSALALNSRDDGEFSAKEIALRKEMLKNYFESKNSPFAADDEALQTFATSKNMKLMVAISFVESTFGKNCYFYNCSGIGGAPPNLRRYNSYAEWIVDFDNLLEESYKNLAPEQFIGLYVQPGSPNWLFGVKQVLQELEEMGVAYSTN